MKIERACLFGALSLWAASCAEGTAPIGPRPFVVATTPEEGATEIPATLEAVSITFSEPVDPASGTIQIEGEGATLGEASWNGTTVTVGIGGLATGKPYRVVVAGYRDEDREVLDVAPYLGDGALDFTTAGDGVPPTVLDADPSEAQVDVSVEVSSLSVTFDEPMDTTIDEAVLTGGPADIPLLGQWDGDGTTITFDLDETLEYLSPYRIALGAFADTSGNTVDETAYLEDGALDFTTVGNPDTQAPYAVSSSPEPYSFNLDPLLDVVTITFSEAMDESIVDVPLQEGAHPPVTVTGVWSDGGTVFTVNFATPLMAGGVYHLDVTGLRDLAENGVIGTFDFIDDGILHFALQDPKGESCSDPLVLSQAVESAGAYTWTIGTGSVTAGNGGFACDATSPGQGHDAVVQYVKTSQNVSEGGKLLHVSAVGGSDDIDLEIRSGSCSAVSGVVESCLWIKQTWDKFLDVPAGTYWIWVSDDDTSGGFPGATVTIEEIDPSAPQAEGEGCFAPYTTASAIHTAPATAEDFHSWIIPASINGYDISPSSGSAGSISCDNHATYGDMHGVDAVVAFDKTNPDSTLIVEVANLDPTLSQSDLDVELLTACDTSDDDALSLFCGADSDGFSFSTPGPAGMVYLWVSTEATSEEFNGVEVRIREFVPGPGETILTAEPIAGSGPINPTSQTAADPPSCFPPTANVHWYKYDATSTLFGVKTDVAAPIAVIDATGQEVACTTNATVVGVGRPIGGAAVSYIAVESPTAIANLTVVDEAYDGVFGNAADLDVTFPVNAIDYSMVVGPTDIYVGYANEIWSFPKAGSATAVEHATAEGLTTTHLGYDIAFGAGRLFSVDSTSTTTVSRLFSVHRTSTGIWSPQPWDISPSYATSDLIHAMAFDGSNVIMASFRTTAATGVTFYSVNASSPGTPVSLGTTTTVHYVSGFAADATYFYLAGRNASNVEGLYRLPRAAITSAPVLLAPINANTSTRTAVAIDSIDAAGMIYARDDDTKLWAIADSSAGLLNLGVLLTRGNTADIAMAVDPATGAVYIFDSSVTANGGIAIVE
jgi:hypothetical protein